MDGVQTDLAEDEVEDLTLDSNVMMLIVVFSIAAVFGLSFILGIFCIISKHRKQNKPVLEQITSKSQECSPGFYEVDIPHSTVVSTIINTQGHSRQFENDYKDSESDDEEQELYTVVPTVADVTTTNIVKVPQDNQKDKLEEYIDECDLKKNEPEHNIQKGSVDKESHINHEGNSNCDHAEKLNAAETFSKEKCSEEESFDDDDTKTLPSNKDIKINRESTIVNGDDV